MGGGSRDEDRAIGNSCDLGKKSGRVKRPKRQKLGNRRYDFSPRLSRLSRMKSRYVFLELSCRRTSVLVSAKSGSIRWKMLHG